MFTAEKAFSRKFELQLFFSTNLIYVISRDTTFKELYGQVTKLCHLKDAGCPFVCICRMTKKHVEER